MKPQIGYHQQRLNNACFRIVINIEREPKLMKSWWDSPFSWWSQHLFAVWIFGSHKSPQFDKQMTSKKITAKLQCDGKMSHHIIEYLQRSYCFAFFEPLFGRERSHWTRYLYRYYARCWKARHLFRFGTSCCQKSLSFLYNLKEHLTQEEVFDCCFRECAGSL